MKEVGIDGIWAVGSIFVLPVVDASYYQLKGVAPYVFWGVIT